MSDTVKTVVLYDVTRLISRRYAKFATGIDRIDIAFLESILKHYGKDCHFVCRVRNKFIIIDRNLLIELFESLHKAWFDNGEKNSNLAELVESKGWVNNFYITSRFEAFLRRGLPTGFIRRLFLNNNFNQLKSLIGDNKKLIYFNAAHTGVVDCSEILIKLKEEFNCEIISYIHDLIPIEYPQYASEKAPAKLSNLIQNNASAEGHFIANSEFTRKSLLKFLEANNFSDVRAIEVIYPPLKSINPTLELRSEGNRQNNYFVILGTIEPRKNHKLLIEIWKEIHQELGANTPKLLIVGKRGWNNQEVFDQLDNLNELANHIIELNELDDYEVIKLLSCCKALLFPSHVEGYGIPIFEAMYLKTPVIASDIEVFREIAGDYADFIPPKDKNLWKRRVLEFLKDDEKLKDFNSERSKAAIFTDYDTQCEKLIHFIEKIAKNKK